MRKPLTDEQKAKRKAKKRLYYEAHKAHVIAKTTENQKKNAVARKAYMAAYRAKNKKKLAEDNAKWRAENAEHMSAYKEKRKDIIREQRREWNKNNKDKVLIWREVNRDKLRGYCKKWSMNNPDKVNAKTGRRNAARARATPAWANGHILSEAYSLAQLRLAATGVVHHVDHIVPLRSKLVCGLHCEFNVRVIPGIENVAKGNRHWPDMPC